jgi:hypothetical protein
VLGSMNGSPPLLPAAKAGAAAANKVTAAAPASIIAFIFVSPITISKLVRIARLQAAIWASARP